MPTYISLVQFTDKGIQAAKETTQRVADWATKVQSMGVSIKQMYWTLGQYDQDCVAGGGHARQHPLADNACFHCLRDGEDPDQGALTRPTAKRGRASCSPTATRYA